jgi:hypothetical protein
MLVKGKSLKLFGESPEKTPEASETVSRIREGKIPK